VVAQRGVEAVDERRTVVIGDSLVELDEEHTSRGTVPSTSSATAAMKWYRPRNEARAWSTAAMTWTS
jgi:hypothetical protein